MTTGEVALLAGVVVGGAFLLKMQREKAQSSALVVTPTAPSLCDKMLAVAGAAGGAYASGSPAGAQAGGGLAGAIGCDGLQAVGGKLVEGAKYVERKAVAGARYLGSKAETVAKTGVLLPVTSTVYTYKAAKGILGRIF